jgi:hypothetical protein
VVRDDIVFQREGNDDLTVLEFVRLKAAADVDAAQTESPWRSINEAFNLNKV